LSSTIQSHAIPAHYEADITFNMYATPTSLDHHTLKPNLSAPVSPSPPPSPVPIPIQRSLSSMNDSVNTNNVTRRRGLHAFSMGFRRDCRDCLEGTPGHYAHLR
jgi:hypothetical protein